MSGEKTSAYTISPEEMRRIQEARARAERLRRERNEKNRILKGISQDNRMSLAISRKINDLLRSTPQGLKSTFPETVQNAEAWMDHLQKTGTSKTAVDADTPVETLHSLQEEGRRRAGEGQEIFQTLTQHFTSDANKIERTLRQKLGELELQYAGNRDTIETWAGPAERIKISEDLRAFERCVIDKNYKEAESKEATIRNYISGELSCINDFSSILTRYEQERPDFETWFPEEIAGMKCKFEAIKATFQKGEHAAVQTDLKEIQNDLDRETKEVQDLAEMAEKRKYVFESLQKVCHSMGFKEIEHSVEGTGRSSRIVYKIDTYTQGKIKFYISLDSIRADSKIGDTHCLNEFDKISSTLQKRFGVQTKFQRTDGGGKPVIINAKDHDGGGDEQIYLQGGGENM